MAKREEQGQLIPHDGSVDGEPAAPRQAGVGPAAAPPGDRPTSKDATPAPATVAVGDVLVDIPEDEHDEATALTKETLLPISGMVRLSPRELAIIDHPAFQRLFEIYQLGQTNLVYRGATHMRGEHAIGTLHAARSGKR